VDIVWCYDYDATVPYSNKIRFAGMTHLGGGLHVYHQARNGTYPDGTWGLFMQHICVSLDTDGVDISIAQRYSTNAVTIYSERIPGVPTNISGAALLGVYFTQHRHTDSTLNVALLHTNAVLVDEAGLSTSVFAPPISFRPTDYADSLYVVTEGTNEYATFPLWAYSKDTVEAPGGTTQLAQTVVYPLQRTIANGWGDITVQFVTTEFDTGDTASLHVTTLGFFWDRYNPGGIY
jgi:hypothetical protein